MIEVRARTYSVATAAKILGIGRAFCYRLVKAGDIRAVKLGDRWLIPVDEVERILASG